MVFKSTQLPVNYDANIEIGYYCKASYNDVNAALSKRMAGTENPLGLPHELCQKLNMVRWWIEKNCIRFFLCCHKNGLKDVRDQNGFTEK